MNPMPTLRDAYLLTAGLLLGVLLGPAVLGRIAPGAYAGFLGAGATHQQLVAFDQETAVLAQALQATGVTPDAVTELHQSRHAQRAVTTQGLGLLMDRTARLRVCGVGVALFVVMLLEALMPSRGGPQGSTLRYALMAIGATMVLARPSLLAGTPWLFVALLLLVGLIATITLTRVNSK